MGLSGFLEPGWLFPSQFREIFLHSFLLSSSGDAYDSNIRVFNIVSEASGAVIISFFFFFFFHSSSFISTVLFSSSVFLSSPSVTVGSFQSVFNLLLHCSLLIDYSLFHLGPC